MLSIFSSAVAHTEVERSRLLRALRRRGHRLEDLRDHAVYFVEARRLSASQLRRLSVILQAQQGVPAELADSGRQHGVLVMPRAELKSPWSFQANAIARNAGLNAVRRIERARYYSTGNPDLDNPALMAVLHDRMTEACYVLRWAADTHAAPSDTFTQSQPSTLSRQPYLKAFLGEVGRRCKLSAPRQPMKPAAAASAATADQPQTPTHPDRDYLLAFLSEANKRLRLALSAQSMNVLSAYYSDAQQIPTDAELVMFAQANSEHCRHLIFNARLNIDGEEHPHTLFDLIRRTNARTLSQRVLLAYSDNAAVIEPYEGDALSIKVETHNHPTAISPYSGAATGSGGEIRDEMAVGRGGRVTAGLCGFTVSNMRIEGFERPWEKGGGNHPDHLASPLEIMLAAPIGAANYNNEYGRPCLLGYFRTFEQADASAVAAGRGGEPAVRRWGYHKPIMIAGGHGRVRHEHIHKKKFPPGALLVVLGGPAMRIGLGGGTSSSQSMRDDAQELDFSSVQRDYAEMQRRCHELIAWCASQAEDNPIAAIHDVGAGGLANAALELLAQAGLGGEIDLAEAPTADSSLSSMEIWCNEAQERYVLAVSPSAMKRLHQACLRERCPVAVIGRATKKRRLLVKHSPATEPVVSLPMDLLLDEARQDHKTFRRLDATAKPLSHANQADWPELDEACRRVLHVPAVAAKHFLVTIADRTVGGLSARDPMVGPWQVPVADCAVSASGYRHHSGVAMAMGERSPVATISPVASARLAISEAITNILSADVHRMHDIVLSANWMADCSSPQGHADLFLGVEAASALCCELGISIPVGKDSLSMRALWKEGKRAHAVYSPLSLVVSAFAPLKDINHSLTPQLHRQANAPLFLLDLGAKGRGLGASALAQAYPQRAVLVGQDSADLAHAQSLISLHRVLRELRAARALLACHDRSDGGLFVSLCEMAFAGHCGLDVSIELSGAQLWQEFFNEAPGVVVQTSQAELLGELAERHQLPCRCVAQINQHHEFRLACQGGQWQAPMPDLQREWQQTSYHMRRLRDNPECAQEELDSSCDWRDTGLCFLPARQAAPPEVSSGFKGGKRKAAVSGKPRVAVFRDRGINGQHEMAAAFKAAGFAVEDLSFSDLADGRRDLTGVQLLAVCGGFSYGDVLGAGRGWALSILSNPRLRDLFAEFFSRENTLSLGVCNGCQMLSHLKEIIPGAQSWPQFKPNRSGRFESRLCMVEVVPSPSFLLSGLQGMRLPIVVAHGEGRVEPGQRPAAVCLRYVDHQGEVAHRYPSNPNGSADGITGLSSADGRATIMMPHPERLFRRQQYSWYPAERPGDSPWMDVFNNARHRFA